MFSNLKYKNKFFIIVSLIKHLLQFYILFTILIFAQQFDSVPMRINFNKNNNLNLVTKLPQLAIKEMNPILRLIVYSIILFKIKIFLGTDLINNFKKD